MTKKPPLGIMPKNIWIEKRIAALGEAIGRYAADPPEDWRTHIRGWAQEIIELERQLSNSVSITTASGLVTSGCIGYHTS